MLYKILPRWGCNKYFKGTKQKESPSPKRNVFRVIVRTMQKCGILMTATFSAVFTSTETPTVDKIQKENAKFTRFVP
jgi:hypothetical protein